MRDVTKRAWRVGRWLVLAMIALFSAPACSDNASGGPTDTLDDALRVNELVMRCTHNSYHMRPRVLGDASHDYEHLPLDQQLDAGVRAFELDVHPGRDFPVLHIPFIDPLSTCENIGACLSVVRDWSERNAGHHLIIVWVEIKDELSRETITDYTGFDAIIRASLGEERLYTMADMLRGELDLRASIDHQGWPTVGETRDKVLVVLLDTDEPHYSSYRAYAPLAERAMFSRARVEDYRAPWAAIAKIDDPEAGDRIQEALDADLLVASNVGSADRSFEANRQRLDAGLANGSHMLCDDFPTPRGEGEYWLDIPEFYPTGCNAVTAPDDCVHSQRP